MHVLPRKLDELMNTEAAVLAKQSNERGLKSNIQESVASLNGH